MDKLNMDDDTKHDRISEKMILFRQGSSRESVRIATRMVAVATALV
jgi:hypothetical protein